MFDVFAPDVLTQRVDGPKMQVSGLRFQGGRELPFSSDGVRVVFENTDDTAGYWGWIDSGANDSVVRVRMGLEPHHRFRHISGG